jgi:tripeptidyl-peptidase-1
MYNEEDIKCQCTVTEYGKLGMMGVTFIFNSSDEYVAGNGNLCLHSGCPFVTLVGTTQIDPGKMVNDPEGSCQQVIYSSGGFSNDLKIPRCLPRSIY